MISFDLEPFSAISRRLFQKSWGGELEGSGREEGGPASLARHTADCEAVAPVVAIPWVDVRAVEVQVVSVRTRVRPRRPVVAVRPTIVQVAVVPVIVPAPDKRSSKNRRSRNS